MVLEIRKIKRQKRKKSEGKKEIRIVVMLGCLSMRGILGC